MTTNLSYRERIGMNTIDSTVRYVNTTVYGNSEHKLFAQMTGGHCNLYMCRRDPANTSDNWNNSGDGIRTTIASGTKGEIYRAIHMMIRLSEFV